MIVLQPFLNQSLQSSIGKKLFPFNIRNAAGVSKAYSLICIELLWQFQVLVAGILFLLCRPRKKNYTAV